MSRVIYFEIHASDPAKLIKFYEGLFGWKFQQWGEQPYWVIETGPNEKPGINGGLLPRRSAPPLPMQAVSSFVCTVEVASVDESLASASGLGGKVAVPKMPIPTIGWLAYLTDPDGNIFGVMQTDPKAC